MAPRSVRQHRVAVTGSATHPCQGRQEAFATLRKVVSPKQKVLPLLQAASAGNEAGAGPRAKLLLVLTAVHFINDMGLGIITAFVPLLRDALGLSYALVGGLVTFTSLTTTVSQPLFGLWCDRRRQPWMVPVGVLLMGLGLSAAGFARSFAPLAAAMGVAALGSAMFHPEAGRTAFNLSGNRRATGMSWFYVGGNLGMSLGPLVIGALVVTYGLSGTGYLLVPTLVGVGALWALLRAVQQAETRQLAAEVQRGVGAPANRWASMGVLTGVMFFRSTTQFAIKTFIPLLALAVLDATPAQVSLVLTTFLGSGAVFALVIGPLADRFGRRPVLLAAMMLLVPTMLAMPRAALWWLYPLMSIAGACTIGTWSITGVMSQEYMPQRRSLASAVSNSVGMLGGIVAAPLGMVADQMGLVPTVAWFPLLPAAAAVLTFLLPGRPPGGTPGERQPR